MPTSEGAPQLHPVKGTSHIPEGETHSGLVGSDGRPLSQGNQEQRDLNARDHHHQPASSGALAGLASGTHDAANQGEQYTARDEGLEPYSAPPPGQATSGDHPTSSGYLPDKKIGPATTAGGETTQQHHTQDSSTGLATAGHGDHSNDTSNNNNRSLLADPAHPDNVLVDEIERRARKSGTTAAGFGTHGDEEPPLAAPGGYTNDASHLTNNNNDQIGTNNLTTAGGYSSRGGNNFDNEGDHTDTEAPDMQPSQSYIQRQSLYSQPPSTRAGDNTRGEPLTQEKLDQNYGGAQQQQQAPFSSRDYGHAGGAHHLVPAGGGVIRPVAGVLPRDAESGALSVRNYEPSHYTQAGMAEIGRAHV